jgi:hypothetical protein
MLGIKLEWWVLYGIMIALACGVTVTFEKHMNIIKRKLEEIVNLLESLQPDVPGAFEMTVTRDSIMGQVIGDQWPESPDGQE